MSDSPSNDPHPDVSNEIYSQAMNLWLNERIDKHKFIILIWFRGHWCPYCRAYMVDFNTLVPEIRNEGGEIYALCAQNQERCNQTQEEWKVDISMTSDTRNFLATRFGIVISEKLGYKFGMSQPGIVAMRKLSPKELKEKNRNRNRNEPTSSTSSTEHMETSEPMTEPETEPKTEPETDEEKELRLKKESDLRSKREAEARAIARMNLPEDVEILWRWAIQPSVMNLGGASDRPLQQDVWNIIKEGLEGVDISNRSFKTTSRADLKAVGDSIYQVWSNTCPIMALKRRYDKNKQKSTSNSNNKVDN